MNPPDKPGWYWYRFKDGDLDVVRVAGQERLSAHSEVFDGFYLEYVHEKYGGGEWLGEAIPPPSGPTDTQRIDFIAQQLKDRARGFELYPVGCDIEYAEDGNTEIRENYWLWLECEGDTFRGAIDAAMRELTNGGWPNTPSTPAAPLKPEDDQT